MTVPADKEKPQATIREIALALFVADELLTDFAVAEDALRWSRLLFESVETSPEWSGGKHYGDCTQQACTCTRCVVEEYEEKARKLAVAEGFVP